MKKKILLAATLGCAISLGTGPAMATSPETEILLELLKTKGVLSKNDAQDFSEALEQTSTEGANSLAGKVHLSGVVEVEATAATVKDSSGAKTDESDISLATAELDIDAEIAGNVDAHLAFLYEEGEEDDHVVMDEGFISIHGGDSSPANVKAGKMYLSFGNYESHFITDPITATLGESNDTAVVASYVNHQFDLSAGVFRGAVKKTGKEDMINSFVGSAVYTLPDTILPGLDIRVGASYISNLATSNTLQGLTTTAGEIADTVGGASGFVSLSVQERFFLEAEFLGAMDDFNDTDLTFTDASNRRPTAWNVEFAAAVMTNLQVAVKLEGSDEFGTEAPDTQYGVALLYGLFDDTSLSFEYLYGEFADNSDRNQAVLQLAIEF